MMDSHQSYTADGNHVATKTDARGKVVTYETDLAKDTLTKVTDPNGQSVNYTYDSRMRVIGTNATADGKNYKNTYTYEKDRLKTVAHNTTSDTPDVTYTFDYDEFGNPTTVKVGNQVLSTNVYTDTGDRTLMRVEYGNGGKVHYTRDEFRRVTGIHYDDATTPRFTYGYGANGQVAYVRDNELNRTVWTEYDTSERPTRTHILESTNSSSIGTPKYVNTVRYDAYGNVDSYKETVNNSANFETTYAYDVENRPTQLRYGADNRKVNYTYDPIGRIATRTLTGTAPYATTYQYVAPDNTDGITTTLLVKSITQPGHSFSYTYDNVGNITREVYNGKNTTYVYDSLGQLIRYNDERAGKSWVFTYDHGGNLTKEQRYAYTEGTLGTVEYYQDFQYGNANWKDQMTRRVYGGYYNYDMTYDAIGNLTSYAGWTYTWAQGRRLVKQVQDSRTVEYTYDASGLRVRKKFNSTINDYTWAGGKLVHLKAGSQDMHFFYDAEGMPAMVLYNQTPYRYVRNLQGDIIAIVDTSGTTVVEYKYDPWGKKESVTGTLAVSVGRYNPFRYRGYIFDEETLMYYLKDRYYYPELRRFINSDMQVSLGGIGISTNLYAYCVNNPVIQCDDSGNKPGLLDSIVASFKGIISDIKKSLNMLPPRQANKLDPSTSYANYNCYGYALKRETLASPSGYSLFDHSVEKVFEGVVKDVGSENIRRLSSQNDPISEHEYLVALRVGTFDYHFMVKQEPNALPESNYEWSHKLGSLEVSTYTMYDDSVPWDFGFFSKYDSEIIYFALQKNWK